MDWSKDPVVSASAEIIGPVELGADVAIGSFSVIGFDPLPTRSRFHGKELASHADQPVVIGDRVTIGAHCVIETGVTIGSDCYIDHGSFVGSGTVLEDGVFLRYRAQIYRRVRIGARSYIGGFICNDTEIGTECDIFGSCLHRYIGAERGEVEPAPRIGNNVFIGMNAIVAGPVRVPDAAIIKAGVIVTSSAAFVHE